MPDPLLAHSHDGPAASSTGRTPPSAPEHLNSTGCRIQYTDGKGRGVFASRAIPAHTLLEISPVLLFSASEYDAHGKYTVLDHYTFKWRDGRMALALGLGSLFNHSDTPNVSYSVDSRTESIRYTAARAIEPDEELCIFYGFNLWFSPVDAHNLEVAKPSEDEWGGLTALADISEMDPPTENLEEIISEDKLPFTREKLTPDEDDEDTVESIRTCVGGRYPGSAPYNHNAEVGRLQTFPNALSNPLARWLKQSGFDTPTLSHLKRIRKSPTHSTLLLTTTLTAPPLPSDPDLQLAPPYQISVPRTPALSMPSLKVKNTLWPTVFAPRRKGEPEEWSRARLRWATRAMHRVVDEARRVGAAGELPIVSHVPAPFEDGEGDHPHSYIAHDIRVSASHPLRHSVLNVIRQLADTRQRASLVPSPAPPQPEALRNGQSYLLTSLTLFTTHEPCLMCSMALLHSRVKEIFYLVPMPRTGGCGGAACVPKLEGVNHRYGIARWWDGAEGISTEGLQIADDIDA
ncbi:hypothetical protein BV25DRAFT_1995977 [Artomyces pyxidatus]|uniref:Uncharacterized protein n=1 Tax=Artomyces pyxidatus TaxID=48021 RepID=A0ACB8SIF6_9AGAM|nr:hypothetical protein BV25DRAFT_1995977 [Artomyces pyxidatus]